ncbi:HNH endonuclease [Rhizobium sullae]
MFDDHDIANDLDNLITLCAPCHRKEEAARKWIKIGGVIVSMSPETWSLYRAANDSTTQRRAA